MKSNIGFTLIEVLIYSTVFVVASGVMLGVLTIVTKFESQQSANVELTNQLEFVLQQLKRLIANSSTLEVRNEGKTLRLYTSNKEKATLIKFESGKITVRDQEGVGAPSDLTSPKVVVDDLTFTKYTNTYGFDSVGVNLTMSATAPGGTPVTRALQTTIARVNAATFDSNLTPNADNVYDLGIATTRWKNGAFSGSIGIGADPPLLPTRLEIGGYMRLIPQAVDPSCTDSTRGLMWVKNEGGSDNIYICLKGGPGGFGPVKIK